MSILDEVVEYLEYAHRYENYIAARCVFHDDSRPSLIIHEDWYNCLACNARGKTESLLDHLKGLPPKPPTRERFENPFTKWTKSQTLSEALKTSWKIMNENSSTYMRDKRGITQKTCYELGIGHRDGWFTFPIRDRCKKIVGGVARADETNLSSAKYVSVAGQDSNLLYVPSWELIENAKEIYCVFGLIDSITLYMYNVPSFSTTGGKRLDPSILDQFRKRILFIPDKEEETDAMNIAKYMGWRGKVLKMNWPEGTKDINEVFIKYPEVLDDMFGRRKDV